MRAFKNISNEIQLTIKRAFVATTIILTLTGILLGRLAYLQIFKQQFYHTLSINNFLSINPLGPTRGLIYDRHGTILADNIPIFSLELSSKHYRANLPKMLRKLSQIVKLSENDLINIKKQIKQNRAFTPITLKLRLNEEELAHFTESKYLFPEINVKAQLLRHYPFGPTLSHILGYVGQINYHNLRNLDQKNYADSRYIGKVGIEQYFETELHGQTGYQAIEVNANGQALKTLKQVNPTPGENLMLTIDLNLQLVAEEALSNHRGAIVILDPRTYAVLAMVSLPTYDPNILVAGINHAQFIKLQQLADHPLYNRAITGLYPLASTVKPYLALAGLEQGMITTDETIVDPGWFQLPNSKHIFRDMKAHGIVDLQKAIATSCDVYFYTLAHKLGIKNMNAVLENFGFGKKTGIELTAESSGLLASPQWKMRNKNLPWYPGDTIISGIGQGYMQATPLQLAVAVATLANRGERFTPTLLLKQQQEREQNKQLPFDTVEFSDSQYWEEIITAMQQVIDSPIGTAHRFGPHPHYTIAAKTGTAQVHRKNIKLRSIEHQELFAENLRDHGLFVAFAPIDEPTIAIAIVVENDRTAAVPIAKKILDYYFNHQKNTHAT